MFRRGSGASASSSATASSSASSHRSVGSQSNMHGQMAAKTVAASIKEGGLSCLELVDQDLGDAGVAVLAQAIKEGEKLAHKSPEGFEVLTKVDIRKNNISDVGVENLTDLLASNHSITEISLSENNITDHGAALFASVLSVNKTLLVLLF